MLCVLPFALAGWMIVTGGAARTGTIRLTSGVGCVVPSGKRLAGGILQTGLVVGGSLLMTMAGCVACVFASALAPAGGDL